MILIPADCCQIHPLNTMADWPGLPLVYAAESTIHGTGVFANQEVAAATFLGSYEGRPTLVNGTYVLWVQAEPEDEWQGFDGNNVLRFLNHSSRPNAEFDGQALYACRSISENEEITIDYGPWFEPDG